MNVIRRAHLLPLFVTVFFGLATGQDNLPQPGEKLQRSVNGGEIHRYQTAIASDEFVHIEVKQQGIDVTLALYDPEGKKIAEIDSPNGTLGTEEIWIVARSAGNYIVEVRSEDAKAKPAHYEVSLSEKRPSVELDRPFVEGMKIIADSLPLFYDRSKPRDQGIAKLKGAEELFASIKDKPRKGLALRRLSDAYYDFQMRPEALRLLDLAIPLLEESGNKKEAAAAYFYSARIVPDLLDRLARSQRCSQLAHEATDVDREADSLNDAGNWALALGDFQLALENYRAALTISRRQGNLGRSAVILGNLGVTSRNLGDYAASLNYQLESMKVASSNNSNPRPLSLMALGTLYAELANYDLSRDYTEKAIERFNTVGDMDAVRVSISNIGLTYLDEGNFGKALEYFERALGMMIESQRILPSIYCHIASAKRGLGAISQARESASKCLSMSHTNRRRSDETTALLLLGEIELSDNQILKAFEYAEQAGATAEKFGYTGSQFAALSLKARSLSLLGRKDEASSAAWLAIQMTERVRQDLISDRSQQELIAKNAGPFYTLIENEIASNNSGAALSIAELMKARNLIDVLNNRSRVPSKGMNQAERTSQSELRHKLASTNRRLREELAKEDRDAELVAKLQTQLKQTQWKMEELEAQIYAAHPELRVERDGFSPVTQADLHSEVLTTAMSVLEFVVAQERIFAIVFSKDKAGKISAKTFKLDQGSKELGRLVGNFRNELESGGLEFSKNSRSLFSLLIKPLQIDLAGQTKIVIIPDGPLWNLPFQALMDANGKYLAEKMAISYAPSLTALREMHKKAKERKPSKEAELVAFGNPQINKETATRVGRVFMDEKLEPLPEAERLVNTLAKMYGPQRSKVYTGAAAREETAKSEAPKYRIVQFATHGILNDVSPMYSHLVLAQDEKDPNEDGLLEAWELKDLDLKADMVILSACDTARGKISSGEGIIGMTWAAFIAGAPTTVASQWKVESSSTTELMLEFHRQLLTGKVSKAEALRRAQLKLMRNPKYKHPSYWAAWVLVGDGS